MPQFIKQSLFWLKICLLALGLFALPLTFSFLNIKQISEPENIALTKTNASLQIFKLPLCFENNEGQIEPHVKFISRGCHHFFFFTPYEIALVLQQQLTDQSSSSCALKIKFIGGNQEPLLKGLEQLPKQSHYFIGNDPQKWHINISNYAKIVYENLYEGIDAIFYGNHHQLEYDLCISPGANPQQVRFHIDGAKNLTLDQDGNLQILTDSKQLVQMQKPFIYQIVDDHQVAIDGEFVLLAQNEVGFAIGTYDKSKMLVIDPVLIYSTYLGSSGASQGFGISVDGSGNAYVTGVTFSTGFPTTAGAFQTTFNGVSDAFITKLDPAASGAASLIYSTYLGGSNSDEARAIAVDSSGNAYITGTTNSLNFPTTPGAFQSVNTGVLNSFFTKLDSTGSSLLYSSYLGGTSMDIGRGIAVDTTGNAYVTGQTDSVDFPTTVGAFQTVIGGLNDAFVSKFNPSAIGPASLVFSTYLGGSLNDFGFGIAVDSSGSAYVTGQTSSPNFPITGGAFQPALSGINDAFVTKLNSTGTSLDYSTYLGGSSIEFGFGIAVDNNNFAYVTGATSSSNFPITPGAFQTVKAGPVGVSDAFVSKLNPSAMGAASLVYSTFLGGVNADQGRGIALDSSGRAYVTGNTFSTDFPTTVGAFQPMLKGMVNVFISKLDTSGSILEYSTYLGGSAIDFGFGIAVDSNGSAYITGSTDSTDFPITPNAFQTVKSGSTDAFMAKLAIGSPTIISINPNFGPTVGGTVVTITGTNFLNAIGVNFGSNAAAFTIDSDTQITAISPPGNIGTVNVTVVTLQGSSVPSVASQFTYQRTINIFPPTNAKGVQKKNQFATQTDLINVITWSPPSQGDEPVAYRIFRNKDLSKLIAIIPADHKLKFNDHNRKKGKTYIYYIVSVDQFGNFSTPAVVKVSGCRHRKSH